MRMLPTRHKHVLISDARSLANWKTSAAVVLIVAVMSMLLFPAGWAWAEDAASDSQGSDGIGEQVAAWALTVPYIIAKGAFALGGAIVGALSYVFSGLSYDAANAVWTPSLNGTYIIRPAHLRGDEAVRFVGGGHEPHDESIPLPDQSTSEPVSR